MENGHIEEPKPAIWLHYDEKTQQVVVEFDKEQIKNWAFCTAVLGMGKDLAEMQCKLSFAQAMKQQAAEVQANEAILRTLRR